MSHNMIRPITNALREDVHFNPLTKIQNGITKESPIFCFPGAGANSACFLSLAEAVGSKRDIFGLDQRGLDGVGRPFVSVSDAANCYADAIQKIKLRSGVSVVSHSFGAWLAFETTSILIQRGVSVEKMVILDAVAPSSSGVTGAPVDRASAVEKLVTLFSLSSDKILAVCKQEIELMTREKQLDYIVDTMKQAKLVPQCASSNMIAGMFEVFFANLNTSYQPSFRFYGKALYGRASLSETKVVPIKVGRNAGYWKKYVPNVEDLDLAGNHMSILKSVSLRHVADFMHSD